MRLAVVIVITVAALFAGGVFYFLLQYMERVERDAYEFAEQQKPGVEAVEVLVADINMPAGTVIESTILDWQDWPDTSLGDGYVVYREDDGPDQSSLEEPLYDMIVRRAILAGEPITEAKLFTREGSSFLSGMLTPGMRAVAIKVQDVSGVGGFIMPGDRVDVIVSLKWKIDQEVKKTGAPFTEFTSETIVQNARVLGIDQAFNDFEDNVVKATAITIEVTPKQAEIIAISESRGELSLALRSLVPGPVGVIQGFTSDRESLYSMGGGFPATERLAQPVIVAGSGGDGGSGAVMQLPGVQMFRAMTARHDLPRGTLLRASDIDWADLPDGLAPKDYVIQGREAVTPSFLAGVLVNTAIKAGEPIPVNALYSVLSPEFLGFALKAGMRAIKVEVPTRTFAGAPGDLVDVVLIGKLDETQSYSETIVQKVRVLSLDPDQKGAVVEVTPQQFEAVALASAMGTLRLSLRSNNLPLADFYEGTYTSSLTVSRALDEVAAAQAAQAAGVAATSAPRPAPTPAAEEESGGVTIYRSTTSTRQTISQ